MQAARILGNARSAMVLTARGAEQQAQGVNNTLSYINISLALGLVGRPFSGYGCLTGQGIRFKDDSEVPCDMVVLSAGIRPNVDIARISGLNVRRGILINDDLACRNDPNIYAIGECAEHRDITYGLVAPLWEQAGVLADRLTGRNPDSRYLGSKVSTKLKVMGVDLAVAGVKEARDEDDEVVTYVKPSQRIYKKLIVRDGQIAGAILLNDGLSSPRLLQAFDRDEKLPDSRAELLFGISGGLPSVDVASMPDDTQICNCNGVSKGQIVAAVKAGSRSLKAVCDATRAGTGCGSCRSQVQEILEFASDGLIAEDPSAHYYVQGIPLTKPAACGNREIDGAEERVVRVQRAGRRERGRRQQDRACLAAEDDMGQRV